VVLGIPLMLPGRGVIFSCASHMTWTETVMMISLICSCRNKTCFSINLHACCNRSRPEDAHDADHQTQHPHAVSHLTNNNRLHWKTDDR
jgi:hypothetical protein